MEYLKEWLSPQGLEKEFGIKVSSQNRMRMAGTLPYSKIGKFVRYSRAKINELLVDSEVVVKSKAKDEVHHEK